MIFGEQQATRDDAVMLASPAARRGAAAGRRGPVGSRAAQAADADHHRRDGRTTLSSKQELVTQWQELTVKVDAAGRRPRPAAGRAAAGLPRRAGRCRSGNGHLHDHHVVGDHVVGDHVHVALGYHHVVAGFDHDHIAVGGHDHDPAIGDHDVSAGAHLVAAAEFVGAERRRRRRSVVRTAAQHADGRCTTAPPSDCRPPSAATPLPTPSAVTPLPTPSAAAPSPTATTTVAAPTAVPALPPAAVQEAPTGRCRRPQQPSARAGTDSGRRRRCRRRSRAVTTTCRGARTGRRVRRSKAANQALRPQRYPSVSVVASLSEASA